MNDIDLMILENERRREVYFHNLIMENVDIQADLLSTLDLPPSLESLTLLHEDRYYNGVIADFTLVYNNTVAAIIEVKAADIGLTDYVRGIGQVLQYEHFYEQGITSNRLAHTVSYSDDFSSVLLIPSSIFQNPLFNVALFKYPETTRIIEINDVNKAVREISQKELKALENAVESNMTSISQYYVRDTRLFEIYMLLKYLCFLSFRVRPGTRLDRREIEEVMRRTDSINNRNWRNVFISLSSFGLIDGNNMPTKKGLEYGSLPLEQFLFEMYRSYLHPYIDTLMNYFHENQNNLSKSLTQIKDDFFHRYGDREVLYFTQSETRYLSSWLNILRDDFGCIDFATRSSSRKLIYNLAILREEHVFRHIRQYTKAYSYITKLQAILNE